MKKFFIIGNGFDIQHGVKSKYSDFHLFMRSLYVNDEIEAKSFDVFSTWRYSVPRTRGVLGKFDASDWRNVLGFLDYCITKSENKEPFFNFYSNSDWSSVESTLLKILIKDNFFIKIKINRKKK
ncbi:MAG: bacteriophage abortive infection AbiH family protein [Lachnospiraceae bacterium]|nr:bacteriophage abortive infection AbiH family protein [Lachnospiraceae bacterium]